MTKKFRTANTDGIILKCYACGHTWKPRVENPKECPNCGSARWFEEDRALNIIMANTRDIISSEDFWEAVRLSNEGGKQ